MNKTDKKEILALGLLSGGLDSHVAVKLMLKLGYKVIVLNFMSPFCTCTKKSDGCKSAAHMIAKENDVEIKTLFMGDKYLNMLKAPKYGIGKGINPCVDCRIMMFRQSKQVMEELGAKFIFTGEVVSQRPMSQMRGKMTLIEKESGLQGMVVRPLSAGIMEPTIPEKEGIIDREEMLSISGRSRKPQIEMGREFGIKEEMLCSSGGCLLTDQHFAPKMKDLLEHTKETTVKDARLLRMGRHFRISDDCKIIVGRNKEENEKLTRMAKENEMIMSVINYPGPTVIISGEVKNGSLKTAGGITARYASSPKEAEVELKIEKIGSGDTTFITLPPLSENIIETMRI